MIAKTLRHTLPLMLLFPLLLFSQQPNTVTIFGTVSDRASGAGLAGVRVEVISEADSSERAAAISDSSGAYRITLSLGAAPAGGTPQDFALMQNYPNPFNPATLIQFQIAQASPVRLDIYNILGQKVRTLVNEPLPAGRYTAVWDGRSDAGSGVSAGIYFYRLQAGDYAKARKMVLMDGGAAAPAVSAPLSSGFGKDAFAETGDAQISIRLTSPFIKSLRKQHVKLSAAPFRYDISAEVRGGILNRKLIIISEPGNNGLVYISGRAGAVRTDMTGAMEAVVVNRRGDEKKVKMPVNPNGSIPVMKLGAKVGDRLTLTLYRDGKIAGVPEEFMVPEFGLPEVLDSKPTNGDKDIVLDTPIIIYFSEPVDPVTVDANSFYLSDSLGNRVPGSIGFNGDFTIAMLHPANPLSYNAEYIITVTTAVTDLQGLHLESAYVAMYKTVTAPSPILKGWYFQNPLPQGNYLSDVCFTDVNTGVAVGYLGTILRTSDGGDTWTIQSSGTTENLLGVFFTDTNNGTVVGRFGTILRTTNGGITWVSQSSGVTIHLRDVYFTDAATGWVVGSGTILHTTNGGDTWTPQNSAPYKVLCGVFFSDANTGWVVGEDGTIRRTTNGGNTWVSQNSGTTEYLYGVYFTDTNTGWVVGNNGTIRRTINGGASWNSQSSGTTEIFTGVYFSDAATGWVVGYNGTILHTSNGGNTWINQNSGTIESLNGVFFTATNTGMVVGYNGIILNTSDGGATWISNAATTDGLADVYFSDANTGTVVGYNGIILNTSDGGIAWNSQTSGTTDNLYGVYFSDTNIGTVVGDLGIILRTSDGGNHWFSQNSGTTWWLGDVYFIDANTGWVAGSGGTILHTTNGGATWDSQSSGITEPINSVFFSDASNGTAVSGTIILRTSDGGITWNSQSSGTTFGLYSVYFSDTNTGTLVGGKGTILHTTDGGATWISQNSGTTEDLYEVYFIDANTGWVVGLEGAILHTADGGTTWVSQNSGTIASFQGVYFSDANTGWAVGSFGTILHTTSGGVISTQQPRTPPTPDKFELHQNYPGGRR
ncbi:MAG: Ig-like domain-containing protein [Calditrichae bacterium]|nr:Ig-like domain-containing protein [Calditrichia bacterium]